ncbi:6-phosphofructokinase 7 [Acorus gramineus]|uniref:6-phosphofructokinase 7 n=1 Tax=Acorus gramineus TaxID=55184 RepID=A0AAV9AT16_ACOGR|nr:6-phosphofructokinase 7 [Acorus gramineus]
MASSSSSSSSSASTKSPFSNLRISNSLPNLAGDLHNLSPNCNPSFFLKTSLSAAVKASRASRSSLDVRDAAATATAVRLPKVVRGEDGHVLEDVPHLTDFLSDLPVQINVQNFMP